MSSHYLLETTQVIICLKVRLVSVKLAAESYKKQTELRDELRFNEIQGISCLLYKKPLMRPIQDISVGLFSKLTNQWHQLTVKMLNY